MKNIKGWQLPNWDNHYEAMLTEHNGIWHYQKEQRDFALSFVKDWNFALDIGGNIGFWSQDLCRKFKSVTAFEPHPENLECYRENMKEFDNWHMEEVALSDHQEENAVLFSSPDESGNVSLLAHGVTHGNSIRTLKEEQLNKTYTDVKMLDDYVSEFDGKDIGFIKVDCQEHEKEIVNGGLDLLSRHNAVLCLELPCRNPQEKQYHDDIVNVLSGVGYVRRGNKRKETIFTKWSD
jgi:FkbM family methyltransferase